MADHNKPVLTSTYANFVSELDARFDDLSLGLDPAVTSATNLPINAIRWNSVLAKDQKWNGSAWTDKSSFYALGSVRFNNGTAGAPSITFSDDTTTGIFKPNAFSLAIATMGEEVMRLSNSNLLLGTTTDTGSRIHVFGTTEALANIRITGTGGAQPSISLSSGARFDIKSVLGGGVAFIQGDVGERLRISPSGNLLVGTTIDNGRKLEVNGSALISGNLEISDGFLTTVCVANQRNPIWRFGDASSFGISYFQGTSGYNGKDSIGVHFGTLNGGSDTGQGSHVTFNEDGIIAKRFQGVADQSAFLKVTDPEALGLDRNIAHITPQSLIRNIRADFAQSATTGTGGNYAGVVTLSPYEGTTASTGGPSYQLAFGSSQANGGSPQLRMRNGIDTTWNAWVDVMTPAGAILHFAMSTAPAGYLKANGAAVSRTAYSALFAAISTTFGAGDGSTTFNLPDLRGEFIRGWADTRGVDSGRAFGSFQTGSVESHAHLTDGTLGGDRTVVWHRGVDGGFDGSSAVATGDDAEYRIGSKTGTYGSGETKPRNIALLACIKY